MRVMLCIAAVAALGGAPAMANEPIAARYAAAQGKAASAVAPAAKTQRQVYICDGSSATRRSFAREFGSAEFVSAEAAASAERWAAPRCMSRAEARKLKRLAAR